MSSEAQILYGILTILLGGGFVTAWVQFRKDRRNGPVERDSIAVQGSEAAVTSLATALAVAEKRADRAEASLADRDKRIEHMQRQLDQAQRALDELRLEMAALLKDMRA